MKNKLFVAIIGDIENSRISKNRRLVQSRLKSLLDDINNKFKSSIASKFKITLGDEFQGLLKSPSSIIDIIKYIQINMIEEKIRIGIGIGEIKTKINLHNSAEIDGPAYHYARDMISEIHKNHRKHNCSKSNLMLFSDLIQDEILVLINSIFSLTTMIKTKWSKRQREIIYAYFQNLEHQTKTAEFLSIKQSSVNKAINLANIYEYNLALSSIKKYLNKEFLKWF